MNDLDWFGELYRANYRRLVFAAYSLTADMGAAEEVAQEAFAIAYGRCAQVRATTCPEAWLRTVAVNLARRRQRRRAMLDRLLRRDRSEPAPPAFFDPAHADLHSALRTLPEPQRQAVVLHYLADLPLDEVAELVRVPLGTVKSRLSRARAALAEKLTEDTGPPFDKPATRVPPPRRGTAHRPNLAVGGVEVTRG